MPRALQFILYPLIFLVSFVFFVYWMFPMESVKNRVITAIEQALGSGYAVQVEEIDTYWITGVKLKNLSVLKQVGGKREDVLKADQVTARASVFSLIFGNPKIRFDLRAAKSRIGGTAQRSDQGISVDASFANLDVGRFPIVRQITGLNLFSQIEGDARINYDAKQPLRTAGNLRISFDKMGLKAGELSLGEMGTFPLPDLSLAAGNSMLKAAIDKGAVNVEALKLKGDDLNIDMAGKIFLAPTVSRFRINLQGKFRLSQKMWGIIDPVLPEKWLEDLKKQKGADDSFPLSFSGQVASPQVYSGGMAIYPFKPF